MDDNFLGFTVEADGQAIEPQLQQRAYAAGVDVTDLPRAGLPVSPLAFTISAIRWTSRGLPQETYCRISWRAASRWRNTTRDGRYMARRSSRPGR
jgi:hypothetical protein